MLNYVLTCVADLQHRAYERSSSLWFRGHRSATWELKSTLHRHVDSILKPLDSPLPEEAKSQLLREEAKATYRRFTVDAWPLLRPEERSKWGMVFAMQHHGVPTRLLDWTESFLAALFFSHQNRDVNEDSVVWALVPDLLNELSTGTRSLISVEESESTSAAVNTSDWHPHWMPPREPLKTIAIMPTYTNPRMTAQRAAFTLMGDSFLSLEQQFDSQLTSNSILSRIELPKESYSDVQRFLEATGVRAFSFYPDLQGIAMTHEEKNKRIMRKAREIYPHLFRHQ